MAGFRTHLTISCLAGAGYGLAGHLQFGVSASTAAVAAGLCGVAGILPDADSDSGQTTPEIMGFSAAVTPWLLLEPFRARGMSDDALILAGGCTYIIIRFGLSAILRRYTVHRGMWHSIPAALIAGLVTWFLSAADVTSIRVFKSLAVSLGYVIHLALDELYSIEWHYGRLRLKKSFGTALKIWGPDAWANLAVFAKLAVLVFFLAKPLSFSTSPGTLAKPQPPSDSENSDVPVFSSDAPRNRWPIR